MTIRTRRAWCQALGSGSGGGDSDRLGVYRSWTRPLGYAIEFTADLLVGLRKPDGVAGTRIEYRLDADETLMVLEGSGEVRVDGGEPIQLCPGTIVSLRSGCDPSWIVAEDFRELWVYT